MAREIKNKGRFKFSLMNALNGLQQSIVSQKNLRVHLIVGIIIINLSVLFRISSTEWLIVLLTIMAVIISELFNTSLEISIDIFSPDYDDLAKNAKDVSAAGVLVTAFFSLIIGMIIFFPKIFATLIAFCYK